MKVSVFTLGCKVNECESDALIRGLNDRGYEVTDKLEKADIYIVNTCAVTAEAEKKSRQTASRIAKIAPDAKIIYTGCAAQKNPLAFASKKNAANVTGTYGKGEIPNNLDKTGVNVCEIGKIFENLATVKTLRTRTYIKVQDGCDNFCSYCIVPFLRGRSRSRAVSDVIDEIQFCKPKEAVITGINLSAYNFEGVNLGELMLRLKDVQCRIRLGSLEVGVINETFLRNCRELYDFAPHFHLSLQSGSDNVLKKMNRRYTSAEYLEKVEIIRKYFPFAGITTDVIAGFPTETDEDFADTLQLIDRAAFSDLHAFCYSPRSGTVAFKMQDLPPEVKKERLDALLCAKDRLKQAFIQKNIGRTLHFLPEEEKDGFVSGYSENYIRIYARPQLINGKGIVKVKAARAFSDGIVAETV